MHMHVRRAKAASQAHAMPCHAMPCHAMPGREGKVTNMKGDKFHANRVKHHKSMLLQLNRAT